MKKVLVICIALLLLSASVSAGGKKESTEEYKPTIVVSILPQQFVVDKIAGSLVESVTLVGPGQNPHSYEPTPRQMALLSKADAWILSQTEFEIALVPKVSKMYPNLTLVDGTKGVTFRLLEEHSDGDTLHTEIEIDRHTWLAKEPILLMANHIASTLISIDSGNKELYKENLSSFTQEVETLFTQLREDLAPVRGATVFVYHPSFGYLFDELGLTQVAVETGGKEPTAKALANLIEQAQAFHVKALFVQAQFPTEAAHTVAKSIGAEVLPLDPLAYDWIDNITVIGETLKRALLKE